MICIPYSVLAASAFLVLLGYVAWKADAILYWVLERISTPVVDQDFIAFIRANALEATPVPPQHELTPATRAAWRQAEEEQRRRNKRWRLAGLGITLLLWYAFLHWGLGLL